MSEEILTKESEEMTEEELAEKAKAAAEQDSSDGEEEDEEEVEESKTSKASVKKEEDDEEDEEEVEESKASVKKEEGEEDEEEEEEPAEESFQIPKTKNQMLKNIYDEVNKMLKSDLSGKYEAILKATRQVVKEDEVKEETTKIQAISPQEIEPPNVEDDVEALVSGEEGLSEDFKKKASTIF